MASGGHDLVVYIAGNSSRSIAAKSTIERLCERHLDGGYQLSFVDVLEEPELAEEAAILATPTIVRRQPPPEVRVVGDLSDERAVLAALDIDEGAET